MPFQKVIGQQHIIQHLQSTVDGGRVAHAQLLVGPPGSGLLPLAIGYANYLLQSDKESIAEKEAVFTKVNNLAHPDLHFVYPVANNSVIKSKAKSTDFINEWRTFVQEQPYGNLFQWYKALGVENKQGKIGTDDAASVASRLVLKSYEGGHKIMIIYAADKMNISAANKLLKLIEEPPDKTILLLLTEDEESIIGTIRSRCQVVHLNGLPQSEITAALAARGLDATQAAILARQSNGDYNLALQLTEQGGIDPRFEPWFVDWVRTAFKAKGNKASIMDLLSWSQDLASTNRETQKQFLSFAQAIFRQALLLNYGASDLVYYQTQTGFQLEKFAPFIDGHNAPLIFKELEQASYHVERNANGKIIFTDLSMNLTRLLHMPKPV